MKRLAYSLTGIALAFFASLAQAAPLSYVLEQGSKVEFFYSSGPEPTRGTFPITGADIVVDLENVHRSRVDVDVSTARVRVGDPFGKVALQGEDMLHTARYPTARFQSRKITRTGQGAEIEGDLTLKGVRVPVVLQAVFLRKSSAPVDNSELILRVSGEVSRKAFGITGFPKLVKDMIRLDFVVNIARPT